jgi:hypothetical protein
MMTKTYAVLDGTKIVRLEVSEHEHAGVFVSDEPVFWPEPPHAGVELHWIDEAFTWVNACSLEEARADKWAEIKAARAAVIDSHLETPYGVFQGRPQDRQAISDSITHAQIMKATKQPVSISWTLANNEVVDLDLPKLLQMGLMLGQRTQKAHGTARELRAAIDAAETVDAVRAIVWP